MTMLPTITESTILSDEVKSGRVYGVVQLYKVLDDRPALEKSPGDVFARTYLTEALKTALDQIRHKFTGQDSRGRLVFTGGYGSGKSHQLLALYHEQLSHDVIGACIDVQRQLSLHCMEVDYQRALELALPKRDLQFQCEVEIPIAYDGVVITKRRVDFVIWNDTDELILETKARSVILPEDVEQCLLYLHQGGCRLCLLVNSGEKPLGVWRLVHTPEET